MKDHHFAGSIAAKNQMGSLGVRLNAYIGKIQPDTKCVDPNATDDQRFVIGKGAFARIDPVEPFQSVGDDLFAASCLRRVSII